MHPVEARRLGRVMVRPVTSPSALFTVYHLKPSHCPAKVLNQRATSHLSAVLYWSAICLHTRRMWLQQQPSHHLHRATNHPSVYPIPPGWHQPSPCPIRTYRAGPGTQVSSAAYPETCSIVRAHQDTTQLTPYYPTITTCLPYYPTVSTLLPPAACSPAQLHQQEVNESCNLIPPPPLGLPKLLF